MNTSLVLEMLREELFAPRPDWLELDAVLSAVYASNAREENEDVGVIADYLVAQVVRRMHLEGGADVWPAVRLAFVYASGHPQFPSREELDVFAAPERLSQLEDPVESLAAMTDMVRRGVYYLEPCIRILAHIMVQEVCVEDHDAHRVARSAMVLLAHAWPQFGQAKYATSRARDVCALLRGVERWGMRDAVLSWTGQEGWVNRESASRVYEACCEIWNQEGKEFVWDDVHHMEIAALVPRYADVDSFAEVACGRSVVVDLREHSALWRVGWESWWDQAMDGYWRIARRLLAGCGVYIGSRRERGAVELAQGAGDSLWGEDGALALARSCALAASMGVVGNREDAVYLAEMICDALLKLNVRPLYYVWAAQLMETFE